MAPLPHNNTALYFIDYATGAVGHTFEVRAIGAHSPAAIAASVDALLSAISGLMQNMTITGMRFQAQGTNVANPVASGIIGNPYGAAPSTIAGQSTSLNFVGRSTGGRRVKLSVFGFNGGLSDFRLTTTDLVEIDDAVGELNGAPQAFASIDGLKPIWYPYANISVNAYWQKELRV